MQTGNTDYIYKNDPDKTCFQHHTADGKYKDSAKRTKSDKILKDKTKLLVIQIVMDVKED